MGAGSTSLNYLAVIRDEEEEEEALYHLGSSFEISPQMIVCLPRPPTKAENKGKNEKKGNTLSSDLLLVGGRQRDSFSRDPCSLQSLAQESHLLPKSSFYKYGRV